MGKGRGSWGGESVGKLCKRINQCYRPTRVFKASRSKKRGDCHKVLSSRMLEPSLSCVLGRVWHRDGAGICSQKHHRAHENISAIFLLSLPLSWW